MSPSAELSPPAPAVLRAKNLPKDIISSFAITSPYVSLQTSSRHLNGPDFSQLSQVQPSQNHKRQKLAFKPTPLAGPSMEAANGAPSEPGSSAREGSADGEESDCAVEFDDLEEGAAPGPEIVGTDHDLGLVLGIYLQAAQSSSNERRELARPATGMETVQRAQASAYLEAESLARSGEHAKRPTVGWNAWYAWHEAGKGDGYADMCAATSSSEGRTPSTEPELAPNL